MPGHIDRPPDFVRDFREMKARIAELEQQVRSIPVIARVTRGTLSVSNTSTTTVSFTDVDIDTAGAFDAGTPDRLTFPRSGVYLVVGGGVFSNASSTGDRQVFVTIPLVASFGTTMPSTSGASPQMNPVLFADAAAGDIAQLRVWQSSGGALDLTFATLAIAWLGVGTA